MKRTIYLPPDLWKQTQQAAGSAAANEGKPVSMSEIIRRALGAYLKKKRS